MTKIESFEKELARLIGTQADLRPFVCDGSPLDCQVFIVGFNPATTMDSSFWDFWRPGVGFDKATWLDTYIKERQSRPLKPGKKRRTSLSNTRRVIEWIIDEVSGNGSNIRCLETNIYSSPTEKANELESDLKISTAFDFLLDRINPKIILAHGNDAIRHIQSSKVSAEKIFTAPHFSRGWSQEKARDLGREIKQHMQPIAT